MAIPTSYEAVKSHLEQVYQDPSIALDTSLLDKLKIELSITTDRAVPANLLTQISQLLPVLHEDPTPITTLAIKATNYLTFTDLRSVDPPIDLIAGFKAPSPPINLLALSLLDKAGKVPSDAAIVAGEPELVASLVELWLSTTSTEVAQAALDTIWALLDIDLSENEDIGAGQGLVWRRIFTDKDVYGHLFSLCSLSDDGPGSLPPREKTVAQGRLMGFLVKAGRLHWDMVSSLQIPEIEAKYHSSSLLHFAACQMVDKSDVLMHMTLLNFFRDLLEIDAPGLMARSHVHSTTTCSSPALDFLISQNLHATVLEYYLDESKLDSADLSYLSGPIMTYVAQYAEFYPNHFLENSPDLLERILSRISESLKISSSQWAHGPVPTGQLNVLSSLPRVMLVEASKEGLNPLMALPTNPPSKAAFDALARVFHGPLKPDAGSFELNTSGQTPTDWHKEAAAARTLYFIYLNDHSDFWADVITAADVLAMKEIALASLSLMQAFITANWHPLTDDVTSPVPGTARYQLPTEDGLETLSPAAQGSLPTSSAWAALTPPALTTLLPYLFKPPRSYAEFVGGGAGDSQNIVWKVATSKYEVLVALHDRLKETGGQIEGFEDIMRTLRERANEGPMGPLTQTGNRVETMGL